MIIFVEDTDRKFIPAGFYDPVNDTSKEDRVKLIFLHHKFIDEGENMSMYIKFNEIDPVIINIDQVEMSSRQNYCIYPNTEVGTI